MGPIAFALLLSLVVHAQENEKVAVVVSAGDMASLEKSMKALELQAFETYGKLGFKVILIGGVGKTGRPLTSQVLRETLGSLKGVKDLRLDFIGHGNIGSSAKSDDRDIPISAERAESSFEPKSIEGAKKVVWYAANAQNLDQGAMYYGRKAEFWLGNKVAFEAPITHREVEAALAQFRKASPDGVTTVNLLNCFSGALAQKLRQTKNTIVFANSPHNTVALDLGRSISEGQKEGGTAKSAYMGSTNGLQGYYSAIGGDFRYDQLGESIEKNHGSLSLGSVWEWSNEAVARELRDEPALVGMIGRGPAFESVIGWCESGGPGELEKPRSKKNLESNEEYYQMAVLLRRETHKIGFRARLAANAPDPTNPERKYVDRAKADFAECEAKKSSSRKSDDAKDANDYNARLAAWKHIRKPFVDDPKAPFRYLLESLERAANDLNKKEAIRDRFVESVKNDLWNLKRTGLDRSRWGGIEKLISEFDAGKTTPEWIIARVKTQLADIRKACLDGDFEKSPCYPEKFIPMRDLGLLLLGHGKSTPSVVRDKRLERSCNEAGPGGFSFGCAYLADTNSQRVAYALEAYWSPKPERISYSYQCGSDWLEIQKTLANARLDKVCVERFISLAPNTEFDNLLRIKGLASRDARGYSDKKGGSDPAPAERRGVGK